MDTYRVLPVQLHSTADAVKRFLRVQWGIPAARVEIERPILRTVHYAPTLHATTRDFHWICVEVSESIYPLGLDSFVLECKNLALPVKLYVAVPSNAGAVLRSDLERAKGNGVGLLEVSDVNGSSTAILQEALSLSLTGVRIPVVGRLPPKYRQDISEAVSTFRNGNPAKGCSDVYDVLEALSFRIAEKAVRKQCWRQGAVVPSNFPAGAKWAQVMRVLEEGFDARVCGCPALRRPLFARVHGITSHRNESAHPPRDRAHLEKRDAQLRTRFEAACDLLEELVRACKGLRV